MSVTTNAGGCSRFLVLVVPVITGVLREKLDELSRSHDSQAVQTTPQDASNCLFRMTLSWLHCAGTNMAAGRCLVPLKRPSATRQDQLGHSTELQPIHHHYGDTQLILHAKKHAKIMLNSWL